MSKTVQFDVLAVAKAEGFDESGRKIRKFADDGHKSIGALTTAILAMAPAAVPVGAVVAGALFGVAGAGGVALLALQGAKREMAEGTPVGQAYTKMVGTLQGNLHELEHTAAVGTLQGLQRATAQLQPMMPLLNRDTAQYSHQLGHIAGNTGVAVVSLFRDFSPLLNDIGAALDTGSAKLADWAQHSEGPKRFVAYAEAELPKVEQFLEQAATAVGHLVMAFAPMGGGTLSLLTLVIRTLNMIPVGTLQIAVPLITSLALGFKAFNTASNAASSLGRLSSKLSDTGGIAGDAAGLVGSAGTAVRGLGIAGLAAVPIIGTISTVIGIMGRKHVEAEARINDLTQAIIADNGALGQNARQVMANTLQQNGMLTAAQKVGVNLSDLTDAALGNAAAMKRVHDEMYGAGNATRNTGDIESKASQDWISNADKVTKGLLGQSAAAGTAMGKARQYGAAVKDATTSSASLTASQMQAANALGMTGDQYLAAKKAADQNTASMKTSTQAMQSENNAAGLLNQALQALGGNNLGVAQAETSVASATNQATSQLKTNGTTITGNTDKALQNKHALQAVASAAIQHGNAIAQQTGSTVKATAAINNDKTALENNLRAQHLLTPAVQAYINTLFKIPPTKRTAIDVNAAAAAAKVAALRRQLAALRSRTIYIDTYETTHIIGAPGAGGGGHLAQRAGGGPVYAGTSYIVGERRPELFTPSRNGYISPRVPSGGAGATWPPVVLEINSSGSALDDALVEILRRAVRVRGGNVQTALGR